MLIKKQLVILGGLVILLFLSGCRQARTKEGKDDFYITSGGMGMARLPLIKPYEATTQNDPNLPKLWTVQLYSHHYINTSHVKKLDVEDSVIYILSGSVNGSNDTAYLGTAFGPTVWFVIDTKKKSETGFKSQNEFETFLMANKYPLPHWYDIDSLSKEFGRGTTLPWEAKQ